MFNEEFELPLGLQLQLGLNLLSTLHLGLLGVTHILKTAFVHVNLVRFCEVKVWVDQEWRLVFLLRVLCVVPNCEFFTLFDALGVDSCLGVHIRELLVLLLDASEFDSAFGSPVCEDGMSNREDRHQI